VIVLSAGWAEQYPMLCYPCTTLNRSKRLGNHDLGTLHYIYAPNLIGTCSSLGIALPQGLSAYPHALLVGLRAGGAQMGCKAWRTVFPNAEAIVMIHSQSLNALLQQSRASNPPNMVAVVPADGQRGPVAVPQSLAQELSMRPATTAPAAWVFFETQIQIDLTTPGTTVREDTSTLAPVDFRIDLAGSVWHVGLYSGELRALAQVQCALSAAPLPIDLMTWRSLFPTASHIMRLTTDEYAAACARCEFHFQCTIREHFRFCSADTPPPEWPLPVRYIAREFRYPSGPTSLLKHVMSHYARKSKPAPGGGGTTSGSEEVSGSDSGEESGSDSSCSDRVSSARGSGGTEQTGGRHPQKTLPLKTAYKSSPARRLILHAPESASTHGAGALGDSNR
jgi:hypothetical protein